MKRLFGLLIATSSMAACPPRNLRVTHDATLAKKISQRTHFDSNPKHEEEHYSCDTTIREFSETESHRYSGFLDPRKETDTIPAESFRLSCFDPNAKREIEFVDTCTSWYLKPAAGMFVRQPYSVTVVKQCKDSDTGGALACTITRSTNTRSRADTRRLQEAFEKRQVFVDVKAKQAAETEDQPVTQPSHTQKIIEEASPSR